MNYNEKHYALLNHQKRIEILHLNTIHGCSIRQIAKEINSKYSTVRQTIQCYAKQGRTNKLHNIKSKENLFYQRI